MLYIHLQFESLRWKQLSCIQLLRKSTQKNHRPMLPKVAYLEVARAEGQASERWRLSRLSSSLRF